MTCFLCEEELTHIPPVTIGGLLGTPMQWVHEECRDACVIAEDTAHARALAKRARNLKSSAKPEENHD